MRLRSRLVLASLGVAVIAAATAGGILFDSVRDEARAGIETRLETGVRLLAAELAVAPGDPAVLDDRIDAAGAASEARITVVARDGRVAADSEFDGPALASLDSHDARPEIVAARLHGEAGIVRWSRSLDEALLYRARRIDSGPWAGAVVRMAVPGTRLTAARSHALREVAFALALAVALGLVAGGLAARRLAAPIAAIRAAAARAAAGDLTARARVATGDELEDLAGALNAATAQLADRIAAATAERDRLQAVLDGMVEGVVVTDRAGRVVLANRALRTIFGLDRPPLGRTPIEALRHPEAADALRRAAATGGAVSREVGLTWPAEKALTLHAAGLAAGGAVGVFHDVTAEKRGEAARREFVANVSHELRTPLATLAGWAEAAADPEAGVEDVRRGAEVIGRQAGRLTALVTDLLRLSRLEAGEAPALVPVDPAALLEEVAAESRERAGGAGIALAVRADSGLLVRADPGLLRQAVANLVDNAIQYCPPGSTVRLSARRHGDGTVLEVADDGPGIPAADQPRVFERFYRVEKGRARETGGTGLGLAIVREVAEVHAGSVAVESRPGTGATFRIVLPRA